MMIVAAAFDLCKTQCEGAHFTCSTRDPLMPLDRPSSLSLGLAAEQTVPLSTRLNLGSRVC